MSGAGLLAQLRQLLALEQAERAVAPPGGGGLFAGGDSAIGAVPEPGPVPADAMMLDLLAGADDDELLAARHEAAAVEGSQEARWLADEAARRGIADA